MLAFLSEAAAKSGVEVAMLEADMADFAAGPFDAAFCPLNSIGLLPTGQALAAHLRSTSAALQPDAPYVTDLTTIEPARPHQVSEEWSRERDGVEVRATVDHGTAKVIVIDPALDAPLVLRWESDRSYTPRGFGTLVEQSATFHVEAVYPETGHDADGVSLFAETAVGSVPFGRSLVLLRRL